MPPKCKCCNNFYGNHHCGYGRCEAWICEACDVGGYCHACSDMPCPHDEWEGGDDDDKMPNMRERNYIPDKI